MSKPYYRSPDGQVELYLGDMREVLPALNLQADLVVADPPYQSTSLDWDRWPDGWPTLAATVASSMWCFGSMRMFLDRRGEFADWKLSQDYIWEKRNGSGFARDRFRRVHETATHWYRGNWASIHHDTPLVPAEFNAKGRTTSVQDQPAHTGRLGNAVYVDTGMRLARSVRRCPSVRRGIHPTQKPVVVLQELIEYACPEGGLVLVYGGPGGDTQTRGDGTDIFIF